MVKTDSVIEELSIWGRVGRQWFKWRGITPIPLLILIIVLPADFGWLGLGYLWIVAGLLMAEGLRIWAVGIVGSVTRTRGDDIPKLVHAGPYRLVRNPLYVANIALYTLTGILFGFIGLSFSDILFFECSIHFCGCL